MAKRVAVIGAGPAGLTAAYQLAKSGIEVDVYEGSEYVGGMARSFRLWGQIVDLGPHRFFSSDPRVNKLWLEILNHDYEMITRCTRIYYNRTFFDYPLKPFNALMGLGPATAISCLASYAWTKIRPPADQSGFDGWVISRFGRRLFEIFFKSYSEKLWGIRCSELDSEFAKQRIKKFSLWEAMKSLFVRHGTRKHRTLVDEFAYPQRGAGMLYERMAEKFTELGGKIHLNARVLSIKTGTKTTENTTLTLCNGGRVAYDHVISTMPITLLVDQVGAPPDVLEHARVLHFRNTILVYLRCTSEVHFPDQWIYIHDQNLATGRITNFRNWSSGIREGGRDTILCLEYWCNEGDTFWKEKEGVLKDIAMRDALGTGLVQSGQVMDGHVVRLPRCYPVYSRGYKEHLVAVQMFLSGLAGITAIGRYGAFKYNNQDHSILMGILAAENIVGTSSHNLWALNSDYEYQEATRITATGLVQPK